MTKISDENLSPAPCNTANATMEIDLATISFYLSLISLSASPFLRVGSGKLFPFSVQCAMRQSTHKNNRLGGDLRLPKAPPFLESFSTTNLHLLLSF